MTNVSIAGTWQGQNQMRLGRGPSLRSFYITPYRKPLNLPMGKVDLVLWKNKSVQINTSSCCFHALLPAFRVETHSRLYANVCKMHRLKMKEWGGAIERLISRSQENEKWPFKFKVEHVANSTQFPFIFFHFVIVLLHFNWHLLFLSLWQRTQWL